MSGGEEEDRTPDLRIANAALSQLSYPPTRGQKYSRHWLLSLSSMTTRRSAAWWAGQYDSRGQVVDSADILARWARACSLVRSQPGSRSGLAYGADAGQVLDVFMPDPAFAGGFAPVLIVLPGADWMSGEALDHAFLAASFADEGALVLVPRTGTGLRLEHVALQLTEAVAWAWRNAARHGGDPSRIVLLGHGAGGHLAAMLGCCDWKLVGRDLPRRLVQGAMSLSGVHDLTPLRRVPAIEARLQLDAASVRRLSPVNFPRPATPLALFAVVGAQESEELRRQTRAIRQAWGARAVPVCEELPGHDHFSLMRDLADPQGRTHQLARQLLGLRWYSGLL